MDQLICASLSHTHCWYEVGMLKVPALCIRRYLRELHDEPKLMLSLKIRMVKAEAIEQNYAPYTPGSCFASSGHSARDQTIGWLRTTVPLI